MMGHTPDGDDLKAKRLADFSDAVARGENPDARGIDPVDAALIRDLHSLKRDMSPDPQLNARLRAALADHVAAKETAAQGDQPEGGQAPIPFAPPVPAPSGQASAPTSESGLPVQQRTSSQAPEFGTRLSEPPTTEEKLRTWWRPSLATIAASLLLFVAVAAGLFYLATNQDDDEPTAPAAAHSTESAGATATAAANVVPSPGASSTESFLIFEPFREDSSVGKGTPVEEAFESTTKSIPWDGIGMVILSGCLDRPCDLSIDDQIQLEVTNAEGTKRRITVRSDGSVGGIAHTVPRLVTELFRKGDNSVKVVLYDIQGDKRGLMTPVYIVILR
jgi:hypothetical protein